MNKKEIDNEFKININELRRKKSNITPYPKEIVEKNELLLIAQVLLSNILE